MAGYGGQMIALDVNTPSENQSQLADASIKQSQADYDQQALPTKIQTIKSQLQALDLNNTKSALDLQVQRAQVQNQITGAQQTMLANAFATFDPDAPDATTRWDDMVEKLAEDGAPQARQYKGRYSPQMAKRWALAYAANSPGAALSDVGNGGNGATSGLAGVDGNFSGVGNGADVSQYDRLFAQATPAQRQQALQSASTHMAAARRVEQSADPLKALQQEALNLGYSQLQVAGIQPSDVPNLLAKVKATYGPVENYLTARQGRDAGGIPQPKIPAELKDAGGGLYSIDNSDPSNPKAKELVEPKGNYSLYTDANGKTWKVDARSGDMTPAEANVTAKIGGAGRGGNSVYEQKRDAYLTVHPGDNQGALDYASGKSGKVMTPVEIQRWASTQATKDYSAISLMGPPVGADGKPVDAQAWINKHAQGLVSELSAANAQPASPPASAPGGKASSLSAPQRAAAQRYNGSKAQVGTQQNPFTPTSEAQYNGLPKGAFYISPDGQTKRKQ